MSADDHGKATTYEYHGCRCDECRIASAARKARRRAERKRELAAGLYEVVHGRRSTYTDSGCRCRSCTTAHSAACAESNRKRRASS